MLTQTVRVLAPNNQEVKYDIADDGSVVIRVLPPAEGETAESPGFSLSEIAHALAKLDLSFHLIRLTLQELANIPDGLAARLTSAALYAVSMARSGQEQTADAEQVTGSETMSGGNAEESLSSTDVEAGEDTGGGEGEGEQEESDIDEEDEDRDGDGHKAETTMAFVTVDELAEWICHSLVDAFGLRPAV